MIPIRPVESILTEVWEDFKNYPIPWLKFLLWEVPTELAEDFYWWSLEKGVWKYIATGLWVIGLSIFGLILLLGF